MSSIAEETGMVSACVAAPPPAVPPRMRRGVSEFDKLWVGQGVSMLGNAFTVFALPALALLLLHASPMQIGLVGALEALPGPLLGLFAGVVADRLPRRNLMIAADAIRCTALATVPVAFATGTLRMPLIYCIAAVIGSASVFFDIAYRSYLPALVETERLSSANAKLQFTSSAAGTLGSSIAGSLVQMVGAAAAIGLDAVSYLVSILSLLLIREPRREPSTSSLSIPHVWADALEGARTLSRLSGLRWIVCATATANVGGAMSSTVMFVYAYRTLHLSPAPLGVAVGFAQVGIVGALFAPRIVKALGLRATMIASLAVVACAGAGMLVAQADAPYAVLFVVLAFAAFAMPLYNVGAVTYLQRSVDSPVLGRVNATVYTIISGLAALGALLGGFLGSAIGVAPTIACAAMMYGFAIVWILPLPRIDGSEVTA